MKRFFFTLLLLAASAAAQGDIFTAVTGSLEAVRAAIAAGADVNAVDEYGQTPLMLAAASNTDPAVLRALVDAGAQPGTANRFGADALIYAARNNPNPEIVLFLLTLGLDPNRVNDSGLNALDYALENSALAGTAALAELQRRTTPTVRERGAFPTSVAPPIAVVTPAPAPVGAPEPAPAPVVAPEPAPVATPAPATPAACVDVNTATTEHLTGLVTINQARANNIIEARPFVRLEHLLAVPGINTERLQEITLQGRACFSAVTIEPQGVTPGCVNVNTASINDLRSLPNINPARAEAILGLRPFARLEHLLSVPGINEGRLQEMRDSGRLCLS